ncbi:MAG TPA: hypothetical protein VGX48_06370 [Pyrinomonadaceae bacterium]|jgi:hypothetical protein|nr:hypothetical protein [Pyrinomonadaceae bacterium]
MKASGAEGRGRVERGGAEPLFPSEGNFNHVVPLSQQGPEEDETTLVPARVARRRAGEPRATKRLEQSWAFLAAAVVLSAVAGAAAGVYVLKWQSPAETARTSQPAEAVAEATPTPQPPAPTPQPERDRLAAESAPPAPPVITAAPREAETKVEKVKQTAPRAVEDEPPAPRPARAAKQESAPAPAPRLQRAEATPPRVERKASAAVNPPPRPSLVTSPPPSAKPNKVIKWP